MIVIMRHGEALSTAEDPARPLSERGKKDVDRVARLLSPFLPPACPVWHSAKARAKETAERFARIVSAQCRLKERDGLNPEDDVEPIARALENSRQPVVVVSHLPFVDSLTAHLCRSTQGHLIRFIPATAVRLERHQGLWILTHLVSPEINP